MVAFPGALGVNMIEHVPAVRVHREGFRAPVTPVALNETVPVGVVGVEDVSVTVAVQVEPWLTSIGVVQLRVVVVWCSGTAVTERVKLPLPLKWVVSPG